MERPPHGATTTAAAPATPSPALLHAAMLLSGFGTVFLGPTLPLLAASAHATDSGSGLFFTAQFVGAFFGGVTTSSRLWLCLLRGTSAAALGFAALAACAHAGVGTTWDAAALLPLGFGVGQMLTSVNLLASRRYAGSASALALVNFSWSLGAFTAPFALGSLLGTVKLPSLLLAAAVMFALAFAASFWNASRGGPESRAAAGSAVRGLRMPVFVYYASLLLLYGGVETSLGGWVTTFGTRYGSGNLRTSALGETALWIGITAGRALAPLVLRAVPEKVFLRGTLVAATLFAAGLSQSHGAAAIIVAAGLLGLSLAPWFPLVLAGMLAEGAEAREVGVIIAVSGLGAAALPAITGAVSRSAGSLRIALLVPLCGLLVLLGLSLRNPHRRAGV